MRNYNLPFKFILTIFLASGALAPAWGSPTHPGPQDQCRFIGIKNFSDFVVYHDGGKSETIMSSGVINAPITWDELVVSWDAQTPTNTWLKVEVRGIYPDHETKYYTMGIWSPTLEKRQGAKRQKDKDGYVDTDTLKVTRPGPNVQLRVTLVSTNAEVHPDLKFIGLSFFDSNVFPAAMRQNHDAWGRILATPERSQDSYPQQNGWCSPTSLSMVMTRWSYILHRPELDVDVPQVAAGIYDSTLKGTGNWPFNTAFAGGYPGMRAYITRFSDIAELEAWINAGIPVIISAPWHLLSPEGRKDTGNGHLTVCIGFTETGDVVINDPATNLKKGQQVRHIYTRKNVINAWKDSHNTVYLVYPENADIPADHFGHWDKK